MSQLTPIPHIGLCQGSCTPPFAPTARSLLEQKTNLVFSSVLSPNPSESSSAFPSRQDSPIRPSPSLRYSLRACFNKLKGNELVVSSTQELYQRLKGAYGWAKKSLALAILERNLQLFFPKRDRTAEVLDRAVQEGDFVLTKTISDCMRSHGIQPDPFWYLAILSHASCIDTLNESHLSKVGKKLYDALLGRP